MQLLDPLAAPFLFEGTNGEGALLLHGFTGTPAHFRMMGQFLNERGYTVHAPLLAGHGTSLEEMDQTTRRDWVQSAQDGLEALRGFGHVHLVGLSMGGLISLLLARQDEIASLTTIDTPVKLWDRRDPLVHILKHVERFHSWKEPEQPPPGEAARYFIQYDGFSLRAASELLHLKRQALRHLDRVQAPALIIQSRADETVRPESAVILARRLGSSRKRILWLEHSRHNALLDTERDIMDEAILEHLHSAPSWRTQGS
ncbi:MAG TPA: alpha/beta fold hydrolase [Actinobacteria bacterium]|nr:carboxylesterase [bacterium BMS3Bbin01]HDH26743.1 alpha/beta fold hydrolase [Actinomycetota bacterium]